MTEPSRRPLMLCADDYGHSPAVDQAIAQLVRARRLAAFSCLTNGPAWLTDGAQVPDLRGPAQAGLHLNLTEGRPLSAALAAHWPQLPALKTLLVAAQLGRLPRAAIADELRAQAEVFVQVAGVQPDYLDGHQHVHHLPGVREAVLALAAERQLPVRNTARIGGPGFGVKRLVISGTGGGALQAALRRQGLPHNGPLLGVYDFSPAADYRRLFRAWLRQVPAEGALLFCHPGLPPGPGGARPSPALATASHAWADPIALARAREYAYLASADFAQDLAEAGVGLAPVWRRVDLGSGPG